MIIEHNFRLKIQTGLPVLTIISEVDDLGTIGDPVGAGDYEPGTEAKWLVTSPWSDISEAKTIRYFADPDNGSVTMTGNRSVTVNWRKQMYLDIRQVGGGSFEDRSGWKDAGDPITITATNQNTFEFSRWAGDLDDTQTPSPNTLTIPMDRPRRIQAIFDYAGDNTQAPDQGTITLAPGWNLFSLPIYPIDPVPSSLLRNEETGEKYYRGKVWYWDQNSYQPAELLTTKTGYWVYCPCATGVELEIPGVVDPINPKVLVQGWQLVGAVTTPTMLTSPSLQPMLWHWDGKGFVRAPTFEEGKGYWILLNESDEIQLGKEL